MNYQELDIKLHQIDQNESYHLLQEKKTPSRKEESSSHVFDWNAHPEKTAQIIRSMGKTIPWITPNVTLHKHSRYQFTEMHNHPWYEMMYVYSGRCVHRIDGKDVSLCAGQTLLLLPGTPHLIYEVGEHDLCFNLMILKDFFLSGFYGDFSAKSILHSYILNSIYQESSQSRYVCFSSENSRRLSVYFKEMMIEYYEPHPEAERILENLIQLVFYELADSYKQNIFTNAVGERKIMTQLLQYIELNFKDISLTSVAKQFHFSPNHISKLLTKATGHTFSQLIQEIRMSHAANMLLHTGETVQNIACECGCQNISFFYKKFQEKFGMSPSEFRKRRPL